MVSYTQARTKPRLSRSASTSVLSVQHPRKYRYSTQYKSQCRVSFTAAGYFDSEQEQTNPACMVVRGRSKQDGVTASTESIIVRPRAVGAAGANNQQVDRFTWQVGPVNITPHQKVAISVANTVKEDLGQFGGITTNRRPVARAKATFHAGDGGPREWTGTSGQVAAARCRWTVPVEESAG